MFSSEIKVNGLPYIYWGGFSNKFNAEEAVENIKKRGHLAVIRKDSTEKNPYLVYYYNRSSKRQFINW